MSKIYNKHMDQAVRTIDSVQPTLGQEKTKAFKRNLETKKLFKKAGEVKKISQLEKKAEGGRIGLKSGTNPFARKSNIKKIQEVFGPKKVKKKEKPKVRMMAKDGTKNKKATKFGMLSVKAGIDKNPNSTYADKIAGAKMKNKKKFI